MDLTEGRERERETDRDRNKDRRERERDRQRQGGRERERERERERGRYPRGVLLWSSSSQWGSEYIILYYNPNKGTLGNSIYFFSLQFL